MIDNIATRKEIRKEIKNLFSGNHEVALFYFSGHGKNDSNDGMIVSYDYEENDYGIKMSEILEFANKSSCMFKIIILDCCHSGFFGTANLIGDASLLNDGVVVMTASKKDEPSFEVGMHGLFTNLLLEALKGGAADVLGNVTPGSIYSYIDQALGAWSQRPLFKANISSFIPIKKCKAQISILELKKCLSLFNGPDSVFCLNPSFEKTNSKGSPHFNKEPYAIEENVSLFSALQKCNRNGLIYPCDCADMYFAAMESKGCKMSLLGIHYWNMIKAGII